VTDIHVSERLAGARASQPLTPATLLAGPEYVANATAAIRQARHRVRLTTLTIADERETGALIEALGAAARRGVDVDVAADAFTYIDGAGTFLPKGYLSQRRRSSNDLAHALRSAGVRFTWLGRDTGLPWRGRTHTKFCVVDNVIYSFGGVNLDDQGVTNIDYMLKVADERLADDLTQVYDRILTANSHERGHRSKALKYGKDQVLVDGGIPGDSIIYRRALKYARKATRVLLVSQYCPTGELGREITTKPHELWFNPPRNAAPFNRILIAVSMLVTGHRTRYRKAQYLHAKCIVFYLPHGKRVAITGSHNFVKGGVTLGTREIALQTQNPLVIDQIEDFFRRNVADPAAQ
jgi:cardiolipin synthase